MLLLFFLAIRLGKLIGTEQSRSLAIGQLYFLELGLLGIRLFDNDFLDLHFDGEDVIRRAIIFEATDIQLLDHNTGSQAYFDFHVNYLLHHLFKANGFLVLLYYFNLDRRLKTFSKIAYYSKLIGSPNRINFCQDKLKILQVRYQISGFFQLILEVLSKLIPNIVNKGLRISKVFSKEGFEFRPYNGSNVFVMALVLSPYKADDAPEE